MESGKMTCPACGTKLNEDASCPDCSAHPSLDALAKAALLHAPLIPGVSGYTCCRNPLRLDYCINLTVQSLLDLGCDEVVVCDSDSVDGTREMLDRWAENEPRLRIINYPWPAPKGDTTWWISWMNWTRAHLRYSIQVQLDADEVLEVTDRLKLQVQDCTDLDGPHSLVFDRLNFWGSPQTLIPEGQCCGKFVIRAAPTEWFMCSDEPRHAGESEMIDNQTRINPLPRIFHLGFLRRPDAFYAKAKVVLEAFFNRYDERLERAEKAKKALADSECEWKDKLTPYEGEFPESIRKWLEARGYII
jgi:glycosyltransferase involved in cell wall biosynthesis